MATGDTVLTDDSLIRRPEGLGIAVTVPWYRSLWLSSVTDIAVSVEGREIPKADLRVELGERTYRVEELADQWDVLWFIQDRLVVVVPLDEPPAEGAHVDVEVLVTGWDNPLRYTQVPAEWNALPGMGEEHALVWTNRYGDGRVFASGIGHGPDAVSHPSFRGLFARGCEWAATGKVTLELPEAFGEPVPGGDWWPTTLEPMVRDMYEARIRPTSSAIEEGASN